jgi:hypothetical protein
VQAIPAQVGPPPEPERIERADDPDVELAARRRVRQAYERRQGRESTDLTPDGSSFSRTALG